MDIDDDSPVEMQINNKFSAHDGNFIDEEWKNDEREYFPEI